MKYRARFTTSHVAFYFMNSIDFITSTAFRFRKVQDGGTASHGVFFFICDAGAGDRRTAHFGSWLLLVEGTDCIGRFAHWGLGTADPQSSFQWYRIDIYNARLNKLCTLITQQQTRRHHRCQQMFLEYRLSTLGRRSFAVAGPALWNPLPDYMNTLPLSPPLSDVTLMTRCFVITERQYVNALETLFSWSTLSLTESTEWVEQPAIRAS